MNVLLGVVASATAAASFACSGAEVRRSFWSCRERLQRDTRSMRTFADGSLNGPMLRSTDALAVTDTRCPEQLTSGCSSKSEWQSPVVWQSSKAGHGRAGWAKLSRLWSCGLLDDGLRKQLEAVRVWLTAVMTLDLHDTRPDRRRLDERLALW